jgi:membrane-associated phospholipid phosphatase
MFKVRNLALYICILFFHLSIVAKTNYYSNHLKPSVLDGFDTTGFLILLIGGATAATIQPQDANNNQWVKDNIQIGKSTLKFGDFFGSGLPGLAIAAAQYEHSEPHGRAHFEAILYNGVTVAALKGTFNKERPNGGNHSMPSGHVSTAFASATSLTYSYGYRWGIPAYMLATLVVLERVIDDAHWVSDTVAGAALGFFWGRATYKHELNILPILDSKKIGLIWQHKF